MKLHWSLRLTLYLVMFLATMMIFSYAGEFLTAASNISVFFGSLMALLSCVMVFTLGKFIYLEFKNLNRPSEGENE